MNFPFQETWLHRVNPSVKLLLLILLFALILFTHNLNFMINMTVVSLFLLLLFSGHPWKRLLLYSSPFLLVFVSTSTSMIFFGKGETTWLHWGLLHITKESFFRGVHLGFRALNFAVLGLIFALTTRPVLLFYSLMQQCKMSPRYAYSFMAAIRLVPILYEEFQTRRYALIVRGALYKRGFRGMYEKLKHYSVPLLAQSIRRAQRIAVAMEAKRFSQAPQRTYYYVLGFSRHDLWIGLYFALATLLAFYFSKVMPYFPDMTDVRHVE